jgi:phosphonatase-like hydrolase
MQNDVMKFDLIFFDLIGTTVKDSHSNESLVIDAFYKSFLQNGFHLSYERVNEQRGKRKREAIQNLIPSGLSSGVEDKIYDDFMNLIKASINNFSEMPGASDLFKFLKCNKVKVAFGSGLPLDFIYTLMKSLNWCADDFNYIGSSESIGKGRPDPVMIIDAMGKLNVADKRKVLKVGDTVADLQEGKNAGVMTAAVLTGTQKRLELEKQKPDFILESVSQLPQIL